MENARKTAPHVAVRRTRFFTELGAAVSACAAVGSTFLAIGLEERDVDTLLRLGYRKVDEAIDADIAIARGGEENFERARKLALPTAFDTREKQVVLIPTRSLYAAACKTYRASDNKFARTAVGKEPTAAVFEASGIERDVAAVFGEIVALDLAAFDSVFGARMRGENTDVAGANAIAKLITELTDKLTPVAKDAKRAAEILTAASARAARIVADRPKLLHCSGAAQMYEALRMLCAAESRDCPPRGIAEMLLAVYVADYYIRRIGEPETFTFPPDNNKRIDGLCEYLGADIRRACVYVAPIYSPEKLRLTEYRRAEFRSELARMLAELKLRQNAAWKVFKRLHTDDGFGLKTAIDRTDLPLVLALAPDVYPADTMLSHLKQTGRLEKYLV